ncbi:MAG: acyl-CoA dehydrogenase [Rhodospirillaceae bacterium]|nr:MAG: acyl-CoA dehydrogenase [Rhodospirillaceae bacterium]
MITHDESRMIRDTVAKFVKRELIPLEPLVLKRMAKGMDPILPPEERARLEEISRDIGLWGLEAPAALGGMELPATVMAGVFEEMATTCVPYRLPPDSPNLHMLQAVANETQRQKYLPGYCSGKLKSAIAISEPEAGGDPAAMRTRAVKDGGQWVINGRKIWISNAADADFTIVMARVGEGKREEGITSFIVDKGTPGFIVEREIQMIAAHKTYEVVFEDCRVPESALLGEIGQGYGPMQLRLMMRRLEIGSMAVGHAQRALDILATHALQRVTFGVRLADRQAIQWWIADIATRLHASRLMIADAAARVDRGESPRNEISMVKIFAVELAYEALDYAMQTLGALGMTMETALYPLWQDARLMRIYEGPTEVHRQAIARRTLRDYA